MEEKNYYDSVEGMYTQSVQEPPKKKSKVPGIILLILGILFALVGLVVVLGNNINTLETAEPVDIYWASKTDQYVYTPIQYMTESVAYYMDMESMQFYIAIDEEWNASVVCIHDDDLEKYIPYIDWLYTEATEGGPVQTEILGYAQPIDADLRQLVMEGFTEIFGEGYVDDSTFEDVFGEYYIQVGQKNGAYQFSNVGILFLVLGIVLICISVVMLHKSAEQPESVNGPIVEPKGNIILGIIGAFFGALLGGVLWVIVYLLGFISGWVSILTVFFAYFGYKMLSKRDDIFGVVISFLLGLVMIFAAIYFSWGWQYYQAVNKNMSGYINLVRALVELPTYLNRIDGWKDFIIDLIKSYAFMIGIGIFWLGGLISKKDKK